MNTSWFSFLATPQFWGAVVLAILAWFGRSQTAQDILKGLDNWFSRRLPANQYAVLKTLAVDAVTYAFQVGEAQGLTSDARKQAALDYLKQVAVKHGLGALVNGDNAAAILSGLIEAAWLAVKPSIVATAAKGTQASAAFSVTKMTVAAAPAVVPVIPTSGPYADDKAGLFETPDAAAHPGTLETIIPSVTPAAQNIGAGS